MFTKQAIRAECRRAFGKKWYSVPACIKCARWQHAMNTLENRVGTDVSVYEGGRHYRV